MRKSVIRKDPQKYIYSEVEKWSKVYAAQLGIGGAYSKKFELVSIDELLRRDGVLIHDCMICKSNEEMCRYWQQGSR